MATSWRKVENDNGFPFYINETNSNKQWDHPKFSDVKQRIDECNYIKYASYRVASKFRVMQQEFCMDEIPLSIINGVFDRHRFGATENSLCLESYDVEAVLSDIYFAANKHNHTNIDIDFATELMLTFLYNIFDKDRKSNIEVASTKLVLALLSNSNLIDLYKFIFNLCSDHNNCVTRLRLQSVLIKISQITTYLNENVSYGQHLVNSSIENCFSNSPGLVGINESAFISWLELVPELIAWLPILHRINTSEKVIHSTKCSVCKTTPITGLKYRCLKCTRYIQCQRCFLTGRLSHSHKLTHTMKEYAKEAASRDFTQRLVKKMCRLIKCSNNVNDTCIDISVIDTKPLSGLSKDALLRPSENETLCNVEPLSSPIVQLQVIIRQLELQNRELQQLLVLGTRSDKEMNRYLQQHRLHVATQIQKLKILKDYIKVPPTPPNNLSFSLNKSSPLESTPMVSSHAKTVSRNLPGLDLFSPIVQLPERIDGILKPPSFHLDKTKNREPVDNTYDSSLMPYSMRDISSWIGGRPTTSSREVTDIINNKIMIDKNPPVQTDLDDALIKLQQILANNFSLDESLGNIDNGQLKNAVTEVEGMLSSLIDNVECNKMIPQNMNCSEMDYRSENYNNYFTIAS